MATTNIISIAKKGHKHWNAWVSQNPGVEADFSNVDFTDPKVGITSFESFTLENADFGGATFGDNFSFAYCKFGSFPNFSKSQFGAWATFESAEFGTHAKFFNASFGPSANFSYSRATGEICLSHAVFGEHAKFEHVSFSKAYFQSTYFDAYASFDNARFEYSPIFTSAEFGKSASFRETHFGSNTNFSECTFGSKSDFFKAKFEFGAKFNQSEFGSMARFLSTEFNGSVEFNHCKFGNQAEFDHAKFAGFLSFQKSTLSQLASFQHVSFEHNIDFYGTSFKGQAIFYKVSFNKLAQFTDCQFGPKTYLSGKYGDGVVFNGSIFGGVPYIGLSAEDDKVLFQLTGVKFQNTEGDNDVVNRLQTLKSIADTTNSFNESRDLFILQRTAELRALSNRLKDELFCSKINYSKRIQTIFSYVVKSFLWRSYGIFGDYGRSPLPPFLCFFILNICFYFLYKTLYYEPLFYLKKIAIRDYTLANSVPFGRLLNPAFDTATQLLFQIQRIETDQLGQQFVVSHVLVPMNFQVLGIMQNFASAILIFLVLLAVRNFLKIG